MVISLKIIEEQIRGKMDEIIRLAVKKGKPDLAEKIAAEGRASKKVILEEILPNFTKAVDALETGDTDKMYCQYEHIEKLIGIFNSYRIEIPSGEMEKAIFFFLNNACCNFALLIAQNAPEGIKGWIADIIRERGLGKNLTKIPGSKEKECLNANYLEKTLRELKKGGPSHGCSVEIA